MSRAAAAAALLLFTLATAGCAKKTPLEQLLAGLEESIEDRDADAVMAHMAADVRAPQGMTRTTIQDELKRYFFAYASLDVSFSEVMPDGEPPRKVSVRVDMSGKPKQIGGLAGMVPDLAAYRFDLELTASGDALVIAGATWQRVDRVGQ